VVIAVFFPEIFLVYLVCNLVEQIFVLTLLPVRDDLKIRKYPYTGSRILSIESNE